MVARRSFSISIPMVAAALALSFVAACNGASSSTSGAPAADTKPTRMTMNVVVLDDQPDPFTPLPEPVPKGIAPFQEVVVFGPEAVELRTYVRLVVQPGETLTQAMARAKPWFDARPLPPGMRFVFSEIIEENEVTKKREPVGARSYIATSKVVLTQDDVIDATLGATPDEEGKPQPVTTLQLAPDATERFRIFTKENALRRIGVLIDGNVVMAARIQDEISGGKLALSMDPATPADVRKAELQRIADGLKHKAAGGTKAGPPPAATATR